MIWLDDQQAHAHQVKVHAEEVRVDTFRASGAGGQHRNKTSSGVRLTHLPTGIVVTATEERSQRQNKTVAWQRLNDRLNQAATAASHQHTNQQRRAQHQPGRGDARDWTWCGWRDEVRTPTGQRASMRAVLAGRWHKIIPTHALASETRKGTTP